MCHILHINTTYHLWNRRKRGWWDDVWSASIRTFI